MQSAHAKSDQESAEWNARKAKEAAAEAQQEQEEREKRRETNKENSHERQFLEAHEEVAEARDRRKKLHSEADSGHDITQGEAGSFSTGSEVNQKVQERDRATAESSLTAGFDTWLKRAQEQDVQEQKKPDKDQARTPQRDIDVN